MGKVNTYELDSDMTCVKNCPISTDPNKEYVIYNNSKCMLQDKTK